MGLVLSMSGITNIAPDKTYKPWTHQDSPIWSLYA
jgi:hypothetical protein